MDVILNHQKKSQMMEEENFKMKNLLSLQESGEQRLTALQERVLEAVGSVKGWSVY